MRIDDLDRPRAVAGAADSILRDLERLGFTWDGSVYYETEHLDKYDAALGELAQGGWTYRCGCSRKETAGAPYPGTCRGGIPAGKSPRTVRLRSEFESIDLIDAVQGPFCQVLARDVGDFVVLRGDGIHAYHLTAVVGDAIQGITEVVRGSDLLDSTPRQIHLQRKFGLPTPAYAHLPVATNHLGEKLSKQTGAAPISNQAPVPLLHNVLAFLGQQPPEDLLSESLTDFWKWAVVSWRLERVPCVRGIPIDLDNA